MRSLFESKSVLQCFQIMFFILYHTGCLGFKLKNGVKLYYTRWSTIYIYIVRFMALASFCGGAAIKINIEKYYNAMIGRLTPIVAFVMCLESVICVFCYLVVTFSLDMTRSEHQNCWHRLQSLDDELIKDFPAFFYLYFSCISFGFVFNLANCKCGYLSSLLVCFGYAYMTGSAAVASFLFVVQMDMLRLRFRLLYKLFQLNFVENNGKGRRRNDIKILRTFKSLEYYFKEYNELIPRLNSVFNVVSSASVFHDFAIITTMGFLLCSKAIEANHHWKEYMFIVFFVMPRVYKVIVCSIYGHMAHVERKKCWQEFVRMENYVNKSFRIHDTMDSLYHWRMHNNAYFTVGRILRFNLGLLFMIFNSIANYIIILIQLQFQQNTIRRALHSGKNANDVEMIEM
ncbi:putative gustatory receptor 47b [Musca vetustissima]|uniref:putative gustatory receptor 47b n=1 Tax=Musca vetustissima TaxID=27455 RepID=UPI002AB6E5B4|nr:putative gustatory receptor 47b [Musca vetustissima]